MSTIYNQEEILFEEYSIDDSSINIIENENSYLSEDNCEIETNTIDNNENANESESESENNNLISMNLNSLENVIFSKNYDCYELINNENDEYRKQLFLNCLEKPPNYCSEENFNELFSSKSETLKKYHPIQKDNNQNKNKRMKKTKS